MSKKILVVLLAAALAVSLTACNQQPAEENSSSSVTQEEYDALKEQNEQLQAELDELKGETDGEVEGESEEDAESGTSSDTSAANGETTSGTGAGTGTGTAAQGNTQAAAGNTAQTSSQASAPSSTTSTPTTQKTNTSSGKGPLAKYTVNVQDSTTPAVKVTGTTLNGKSALMDDDVPHMFPLRSRSGVRIYGQKILGIPVWCLNLRKMLFCFPVLAPVKQHTSRNQNSQKQNRIHSNEKPH